MLDANELRELERLSARYRIHFDGEIDQSKWPDEHRATFTYIKELGEKKFSTYAIDFDKIEDQPWKAEVKKSAVKLVELAKRCRSRNESTWRDHCEPIILARLSAEVVW
jgi:hypothetical protein